jgi:6-phosphogluconolactonase
MPQPELRIVNDPAATVGELIADQAKQGGSIVLTGGATPGKAYERAAERARDWSRVDVWWGDERCVPPDDDRSNYKLAKDTLLERLDVPPRSVHRIDGERAPAEAAAALDRELDGVELHLLLLGLGPDGHIASLFPGSPQLAVEDRRATSGPAGLEPFVDRVTMTLPVLRSAYRIVFLVTGEAKADAVADAFGADINPAIPGSLIRLAPVAIEVFLDQAAASKLEGSRS